MLEQVVRWKAAQSSEHVATSAPYRLHVLTHRVFVDAQWPEYYGGRR
jgi:hypothetical protein